MGLENNNFVTDAIEAAKQKIGKNVPPKMMTDTPQKVDDIMDGQMKGPDSMGSI